MMFDEVDAFLDNDNVAVVQAYMKQLSSTDKLT
jgi:chromosome segregation ATPase